MKIFLEIFHDSTLLNDLIIDFKTIIPPITQNGDKNINENWKILVILNEFSKEGNKIPANKIAALTIEKA